MSICPPAYIPTFSFESPPLTHPTVARVQKIINADPERLHTSKNAAFAIALATEMFIQHLATTTHNVVKTERKPRRNIQYRDVASAIAKTDNLEFLVDVVPKTVTFKEYKKRADAEKKAKDVAAQAEKEKEKEAKNGDAKAAVNGHGNKAEEFASRQESGPEAIVVENRTDAMEVDQEETKEEAPSQQEESEPEEDGAAMQIEMEMRGPRTNGSPEVPKEAPPRKPSGFTAINGAK